MHAGAPVGILLLDTHFPRIPGDIGNPATFDFPVRYHRVAGASAEQVVRGARDELLPLFVEGARVLKREGARAISTSCGFLARFQDRMNWLNRLVVGCECNRQTLAAIEGAGFTVSRVEHTTLPEAPKFTRPLIVGAAVSS